MMNSIDNEFNARELTQLSLHVKNYYSKMTASVS